MFLFLIVVALLLGLGVVYGLSRFRPEYVEIGAAVTLGFTLLVWLIGRASLPLEATVSRWPAAAQLPPLAWLVDGIAWTLTTGLLLLALATLLIRIRQRTERPSSSLAGGTIVLVLAGAMAVWPESPAGLLVGWLLLNLTWAGVLLLPEMGAAENRPASRFAFLFLSVLLVWLGSSGAPAGAGSWDFTGWPAWAILALLFGVLAQMSLFLLYGGRPFSQTRLAGWPALLSTVPAIAGIVLLARVAVADGVAADYGLLLIVVGVLGALAALLPLVSGWWPARSATSVQQRWDGVAGRWREWQVGGGRLVDGLRQLMGAAGTALREAAHILEGEGGLLWLLLLVVVFWLARRG